MLKDFEKDLEIVDRLCKSHDQAENEADKKVIENDFQEFKKYLAAKGEDYAKLFWKMEEARQRGNQLLNLMDSIFESEVLPMVESFRKYGIEKFTISSRMSGMNETIWAFMQNGCTLEGMTEVYTYQDFFAKGNQYKKEPAFLLKVN